jgi:hypothetical protein
MAVVKLKTLMLQASKRRSTSCSRRLAAQELRTVIFKTLSVQGVLSIVLQLILSIGVPVFQHVVVRIQQQAWCTLTPM